MSVRRAVERIAHEHWSPTLGTTGTIALGSTSSPLAPKAEMTVRRPRNPHQGRSPHGTNRIELFWLKSFF
jgi:hypothetical protein